MTRMLKVLLAGVLAFALLPGVASAAPVRLALPKPTGGYAVGSSTLALTDSSRTDPWVPSSGARRLMVSMFYPALLPVGPPRPYLTVGEAKALLDGQKITGVDPKPVADTATYAHEGAPPVPKRFPLVVLSPGFTLSRSTLTGLAEDLASRGYVVAAIGHNYEAFGTSLPDGTMTTCVACEAKQIQKVPLVRAADTGFVLSALRTAWPFNRLIDPSRIAMAGHSIGGNSASQAMLTDDRIRAGINLDGSFFAPVPPSGIDRPFLLLGTRAGHNPAGDPSWPRDWPNFTGWKRWLTADGTGHMSFTDLPVFGDQIGRPSPGVPMTGARSMEITRSLAGSFFDLTLKGVPAPVFDDPAAKFPELAVSNPNRVRTLW